MGTRNKSPLCSLLYALQRFLLLLQCHWWKFCVLLVGSSINYINYIFIVNYSIESYTIDGLVVTMTVDEEITG